MATLKNLVDETTNIKNNIVRCRDTLKQILIDKKIEGLENENKLSTLVDKINILDDYSPNILGLYKNGNEYTNVTGGWIAENCDDGVGTQISCYSSKDNNILHVYSERTVSGNSNRNARYFRTVKKINLTNYATLEIDITAESNNSGQSKVSIYKTDPPFKSNFDTMSPVADLSVVKTSLTNSNATINVSALSGEYYICIMSLGASFNAFNSANNYIKIKRLELKK